MLSATRRPAADTLVEALVEGALRWPYAVTFFPASKEGIDLVDLEDASARQAAGFLRHGVPPGALVGLLVSPGPEFLVNLFGALRIGAVVAVLPSTTQASPSDSDVARLTTLIRAAGVRYLVVGQSCAELADRLATVNPTVERLDAVQPAARTALPPVSAHQRGLVLFTAGRTGRPKAMARTHGQLMAGIEAFRGALGLSSHDNLVQWLPLYHPLGLFGLLSHLLYGGTTHAFTPAWPQHQPREVLRCISECRRASVTMGTNSCYESLSAAFAPRYSGGLDLSRWRVALNAGEPVLAGTVERFRQTFALAGVRRTTMHPMYYVTEAVLAVTGKLPDTPPDIVTVDQQALYDTGTIRFARATNARPRSYVSSGVPVEGVDCRIANEVGADVGNGVLGDIQIRSPAVAGGYHRDLRATMKALDNGWFRTGDRGFLWHGQLFVAGDDHTATPDGRVASRYPYVTIRAGTGDLIPLN